MIALLKRDHGIEVKSASSTIEEVVARQFVNRLARQRNIDMPSNASFADSPSPVIKGRKPAGKPEPAKPAGPVLGRPRLVKSAKQVAPVAEPARPSTQPAASSRSPSPEPEPVYEPPVATPKPSRAEPVAVEPEPVAAPEPPEAPAPHVVQRRTASCVQPPWRLLLTGRDGRSAAGARARTGAAPAAVPPPAAAPSSNPRQPRGRPSRRSCPGPPDHAAADGTRRPADAAAAGRRSADWAGAAGAVRRPLLVRPPVQAPQTPQAPTGNLSRPAGARPGTPLPRAAPRGRWRVPAAACRRVRGHGRPAPAAIAAGASAVAAAASGHARLPSADASPARQPAAGQHRPPRSAAHAEPAWPRPLRRRRSRGPSRLPKA